MTENKKQFVFKQSLDHVFQNPLGSWMTNMFCGGLLFVLLFPVNSGRLALWLAILFMVSSARTVLAKVYHRQNAWPLNYWHSSYAVGTLISAAVWAIPIIFIYPEFPLHQLCLVAVIVGLLVGAGQSHAPFPILHTTYSMIIIGPLAARFYASGHMGHKNFIVALFLAGIILLIDSLKVRKIVYNSFELRYKINRTAIIDSLTELKNRRHFDDIYALEWQRAQRNGTPLSLLMIDVDHFKKYNDIYGHPAGDQCLKKIACVIREAVNRPADTAARYGGEEFAVLLPEVPNKGARKVAERIRQGVMDLGVAHSGNGETGTITISIGLATMVITNGCRAEWLISAADKALYAAKSEGRNRVIAHKSSIPKKPIKKALSIH